MEKPSLNKILGKLEKQEMSRWQGYFRGFCSPTINVSHSLQKLRSDSSDFYITVDSFDFLLLSPDRSNKKSEYYLVEVKANSEGSLNESYSCRRGQSEFDRLECLCKKIHNYAVSLEHNKKEETMALLHKTLD